MRSGAARRSEVTSSARSPSGCTSAWRSWKKCMSSDRSGARRAHAIGPVSMAPYLGQATAPLRRIVSSLASVTSTPRDREARPGEIDARLAGSLTGAHRGAGERSDPRRFAAADHVRRPARDGQGILERCEHGARQRRARGEARPADEAVAPAVSRMQVGVGRVDLGEPACHAGAEAAELEHPIHRRAAGDRPHRLDPPVAAPCVDGETDVHAVVTDEREVHQPAAFPPRGSRWSPPARGAPPGDSTGRPGSTAPSGLPARPGTGAWPRPP